MKRYAPKINAFNHTLEGLRAVRPPGFEFKPPTDVMFHRNDPKIMNAVHSGMPTTRKPDVILARRQAIAASQKGGQLEPTRAPLLPFDWHMIDSPMEEKCYKKKIDPPPASYSTSLLLYIPAAKDVTKPLNTRPMPDPGESMPFVEHVDDELDVEEESEEPEDDGIMQFAGREDDEAGEDGESQRREQSGEGKESEDGEGSVQEGNTRATSISLIADILAFTDNIGPSSGTNVGGYAPPGLKRRWSGVEDTPSKRLKRMKGSQPQTKASPIVQNALYASEMLNRGVHALNTHGILIAGEPICYVLIYYLETIIHQMTLRGFGTLIAKAQFRPQASILSRTSHTLLPFFSHFNVSACGTGVLNLLFKILQMFSSRSS